MENKRDKDELIDEVRTGSVGDDKSETRVFLNGETEFRDNINK